MIDPPGSLSTLKTVQMGSRERLRDRSPELPFVLEVACGGLVGSSFSGNHVAHFFGQSCRPASQTQLVRKSPVLSLAIMLPIAEVSFCQSACGLHLPELSHYAMPLIILLSCGRKGQ